MAEFKIKNEILRKVYNASPCETLKIPEGVKII